MSLRSPLRGTRPNAVSVCGKLLAVGEAITVLLSAIGPRERSLAAKGKVKIRPSNEKGKAQIICTLGEQ